MSGVAKILIVLNLVLAIAFLGAAATFLGVQESYKLRWEKDTAEKDAEIVTLTEARNAESRKYNDQREMVAQKEIELQTAKSKQEAKDAEYENVVAAHNRLLADYESLLPQDA